MRDLLPAPQKECCQALVRYGTSKVVWPIFYQYMIYHLQNRITIDTYFDNAFYLHRENGTNQRFGFDSKPGVYYYDTTVDYDSPAACFNLISEQKKLYSQIDNRRAAVARKIQQAMGFYFE